MEILTRSGNRRNSAFTLMEVVIAGGMLVIFVAAAVTAMTQINRWASAARLRTLALVIAQQKVDEVLKAPWTVLGSRSTILQAGAVTESSLPLNNDPFNNASGLGSAFTDLDTPVNASRTTVVTDLPPRMVRAVVTVNYTYRSHPYTVSLTTLRSTDDF